MCSEGLDFIERFADSNKENISKEITQKKELIADAVLECLENEQDGNVKKVEITYL